MVHVLTPSSSTAREHPEGDAINVVDGVLYVNARGQGPVAVYAREHWRHAEVINR